MNRTIEVIMLGSALSILTGAVGLVAVYLRFYRAEWKAFEQATRQRLEGLEAALPSKSNQLALSQPTRADSSRDRSNILHKLHLGEAPEQISEDLGIPVPTIRLMRAVDRIAGKGTNRKSTKQVL